MGLRHISRSLWGCGRLRVLLAITLLYFLTQLLTFRLGIIPADEGFAALTPLRVLGGERPYLDFWWLYGPAGLFLNAGLYKLFGVSLVTLRLAGVVAGYGALLLCWRLAMRLMTPGWAGAAATVALALYRLPTYNYNHIYAAVVGLLALDFACRGLETRRAGWWAASGAMIGLLCSFKFNVGVQAGAAVVAFMLIFGAKHLPAQTSEVSETSEVCAGHREQMLRPYVWFVGSALGIILAQNLLLLAWLGTGSMPAIYAPQLVVAGEKAATWALWDNLLTAIPRSVSREGLRQLYYLAMFLLPVAMPVVAWLASRRDKPAARDVVCLLALYSPAIYVQAFIVGDPLGSTGDNSALLVTSLLLLTYALYRWVSSRQGRAVQGFAWGAAAVVLVAVYAGALVRYATPGKYDYALSLERARGVRVSRAYGENLEDAVKFIQAEIPEGEAIAAVPWAGDLLAFLSGRPPALRTYDEFAAAPAGERPAWVVLTNALEARTDAAHLSAILDAEYDLVREFGTFAPLTEAVRRSDPRWEDRLAYRVYRRSR